MNDVESRQLSAANRAYPQLPPYGTFVGGLGPMLGAQTPARVHIAYCQGGLNQEVSALLTPARAVQLVDRLKELRQEEEAEEAEKLAAAKAEQAALWRQGQAAREGDDWQTV